MSGQRYYHTHGNNAVVLEEAYGDFISRSRQPKKQITTQTKPAVKPRPRKTGLFSTLVILMSIFTIFSFVIARYAIICTASNDIGEIKTDIKEMQKKADELKVEITQKMDMSAVQQIAKDKLKMNFPKEDQIVFMDLGMDNSQNSTNTSKANENQVSKGDGKNINVLSEIMHALE